MKKARRIFTLIVILFAILPVAGRAQSAQFVASEEYMKELKAADDKFDSVQAVKDVIARGFCNSVVDVSELKLAADDVVVVSFFSGSGLVRKQALVLRKEQFTKKLAPVMLITFQDPTTKLWDFPFFKEMQDNYLKLRCS